MKPDIIVSWPNNCDYPLWRQFIRDNRHRFNKVIVVFTQTHRKQNFVGFVTSVMSDDEVTFLTCPPLKSADEDWRNIAVNLALQHSRSKWVWFTEQDFYTKNYFWDEIESHMIGDIFDVIATFDGRRMHPCNIFAKRETIDQTSRNFGIVPNKLDHFALFQQDLENGNARIARVHPSRYYHYNGLSSNFTLLSDGLTPNYHPDDFMEYLGQCMKVTVPLSPEFTAIAARVFPQSAQ